MPVELPVNPPFRSPDVTQPDEVRAALNRLNEKIDAMASGSQKIVDSLPLTTLYGSGLLEVTVDDIRTISVDELPVGDGIQYVGGLISAQVVSPIKLDVTGIGFDTAAFVATFISITASDGLPVLMKGGDLCYATFASLKAAIFVSAGSIANVAGSFSFTSLPAISTGSYVPDYLYDAHRVSVNAAMATIVTSLSELKTIVNSTLSALRTQGLIT